MTHEFSHYTLLSTHTHHSLATQTREKSNRKKNINNLYEWDCCCLFFFALSSLLNIYIYCTFEWELDRIYLVLPLERHWAVCCESVSVSSRSIWYFGFLLSNTSFNSIVAYSVSSVLRAPCHRQVRGSWLLLSVAMRRLSVCAFRLCLFDSFRLKVK